MDVADRRDMEVPQTEVLIVTEAFSVFVGSHELSPVQIYARPLA